MTISRCSNTKVRDKLSTYLINIFSLISVLSILGLTFFADSFEKVAEHLGLADNILFPFYITSTFLLSLTLYKGISEIKETQFDKFDHRFYFVILMAFQTGICKKFLKMFINYLILNYNFQLELHQYQINIEE